jgi:hypothetical protein
MTGRSSTDVDEPCLSQQFSVLRRGIFREPLPRLAAYCGARISVEMARRARNGTSRVHDEFG